MWYEQTDPGSCQKGEPTKKQNSVPRWLEIKVLQLMPGEIYCVPEHLHLGPTCILRLIISRDND
jgi:hypothetical protein